MNFPASPALNDIYSFSGKSWQWNGVFWASIDVFGGTPSTITPDAAAAQGTSTSLARSDHVHAIAAAAPVALGASAAEGTSTSFARADHVHPFPTKTNVGLGNVDNTSDVNKPISTATQTALNAKQDTLVSGTNIKTINGVSVLGSGDLVVSGGGAAASGFEQTFLLMGA